jgi:hypothetical protein
VNIILHEPTAPAGPTKRLPVLDGLSASSVRVPPSSPVAVSVTAHSPEGHTLGYAWSDDCGGSFDDATATSTTWTSPGEGGTCQLSFSPAMRSVTVNGSGASGQDFVSSEATLDCGIFCEDFEAGLGPWAASNGVWEVGAPTSGPNQCNSGTGCAATVLGGDYPNTDSDLVSPSFTLPTIGADEELQLRFWHWFSFASGYSGYDEGVVYIQEQTSPGVWSASVALDSYAGTCGGVWTRPMVDLSAHAGKKVRILFGLVNGSTAGVSSGWYIDEVSVAVQ